MAATVVPADPNLNALWCRCIAEELVRSGVTCAVLCPGSRNSPLLFALAAQDGLTTYTHIDERSAGFLALGLARAGDGRVAVCVTSGSALANLLPAVAEADAAGLPLVVVAADRPWELQGCGAPQTMAQRGLFGRMVRAELALGEPTADSATLRRLRARVSRLAQHDDGPVLLDVPLRDPLPPLPDDAWPRPELARDAVGGRDGGRAFTTILPARGAQPLIPQPWMRPGLKGLIVAGCAEGRDLHPGVAALAAATGWPLLADAPSGLRRTGLPTLITTADALVGGPMGEEVPELVVQAGPAPLARATYEWLARQDCPWVAVEGQGDRDWLGRAWLALQGDAGAALQVLATCCAPGDEAWRGRWQAAERQARGCLATAMAGEPWGEVLAAHRALLHPGFAFLHLASGMAVRHGNLYAGPQDRPVYANRGLNGIDGTLGTFLGECLANGRPGLLLTGDLAFLHDLPALAAAADPAVRGAIVMLNNDGGGIFDFLAVARVPGYERLIRTPHGMTFAASAGQFGIAYRPVDSRASLDDALAAATHDHGLTLIECAVAGTGTVDRHRRLLGLMAG